MHLLDPRNGPGFDWPPTPHRSTLLVASTPRTGSTLLCRALWDTGQVGAPKEYLNPMQLRDWSVRSGSPVHPLLRGPLVSLAGRRPWTDQRLRRRLDLLRAHRTTPGGWFGLKIHHHHFQRLFVTPGRDPEAFLGPVTWVRLRREDRLRQAISWVRALQSGRWVAQQRGWLRPRYHRRSIDRALRAIEEQETGWSQVLTGQRVLDLTYEQVAADLVGSVNAVLQRCQRPPVDQVVPTLTRQADPATDAWIARYRAGC